MEPDLLTSGSVPALGSDASTRLTRAAEVTAGRRRGGAARGDGDPTSFPFLLLAGDPLALPFVLVLSPSSRVL